MTRIFSIDSERISLLLRRCIPAIFAIALLVPVEIRAVEAGGNASSVGLDNPFVFSDPVKLPPGAIPKGAAIEFTDDFLMVAGGRNADGTFSDAVTVFMKASTGNWQPTAKAIVPTPFADAAVAGAEGGMVVVGGATTGNDSLSTVQRIEYNPTLNRIAIHELPPLPSGRSKSGALLFHGTLYVAGGSDRATKDTPSAPIFWSIDLTTTPRRSWQTLPVWPGSGLDNPILASQNFGDGDSIYLLGGSHDGVRSRALFEFRPDQNSWTRRKDSPVQFSFAGASAVGSAHIFVAEDNPDQGSQISFLAYHTITGTWASTPAISLSNSPLLIRGTPEKLFILTKAPDGALETHSGKFPPFKSTMRAADFGILGLYFALIFFLAWFFSRKEHTTDDYFRAGKRVPGWTAGISILATRFSAISFMTYPAKSFSTNWTYFLHQFVYPVTVFFVIKYVVSFFVRLDVTTAYEYLDKRFGATIRLIGSLKFVLFELLRMGLLILIPSMILSVIIGVDLNICIILIGVVATIYTCLGGIEGVIWIEVLQFGIILSGTVMAIAVAIHGTPGGVFQIFHSASIQGKTKLLDFSWSFTTATVWVFILDLPGAANESVSAQYVVQRFISVKDLRQASQSMLINCFAGPVLISLFFLLGTSIFVYYQANPSSLNPAMLKQDEVMAWFIAKQLPTGIAGLMIAAILASTMSSLESSLSSTIAVAITDLYRPRSAAISDRKALRKAKHLTIVAGIFGITSALVLAAFHIRSLLDYVLQVAFLAGGGLAGIFYLGIFTTRANTPGVLIGFGASATCLGLLTAFTHISLFAFNGIGVIVCVAVGYGASYLFPDSKRLLKGLTVHTLKSTSA